MVALNGCTSDGERLDAVGIDSALAEPLHILELTGFLIEYLDEAFADNLAFFLRLGYTCELAEEFLRSVNTYNIEAEALIVAEDILELVFAEHAVIHKYASEVLADGLVEEHGSH